MKIGIVGDLHMGVTTRVATITNAIVKGQRDFIDKMATDFEQNGIDTLVFVGDIFDNRKFISTEVLEYVYNLFKVRLAKFTCYVIAGNHDFLYDNSADVCSIRFLEQLPNVKLFVDKVGLEEIDGKKWFFVPWVFPEEMDKVNKWLVKMSRDNIDDNVIVGHFDICGARMEAKTVSTAGFDMKRFLNAAKLTISGHYHCKSEIEMSGSKIHYVGTPYQLTFGHVGIPAGYHIYEDGELTFVENDVSPNFIDVRDAEIDNYDNLSNGIVRFQLDTSRSFDDAAMLKAKLESLNPIYIIQVPYGEIAPIDEKEAEQTEEEARQLMATDSIGMAALYLEKHPELLPTLSSGEDAKEVAISYIKEYNAKIK